MWWESKIYEIYYRPRYSAFGNKWTYFTTTKNSTVIKIVSQLSARGYDTWTLPI
jgi:hypothetical protein